MATDINDFLARRKAGEDVTFEFRNIYGLDYMVGLVDPEEEEQEEEET